MEEQIKNIVSQYIRIPAGQIAAQTVIDRSAVASSIILHRMYAQLANEGIEVKDYTVIKTYGQLLANINGKEMHAENTGTPVASFTPIGNTNELPVGIDMENISSMPVVNDFRDDAFYKMNFAPAEIAYCILQTNPYASFAGLFAAKEAIVKADNTFKDNTFNTIFIDHTPEGKPIHPHFQVSITHTTTVAIAVAIKNIDYSAPSNLTLHNKPVISSFTSITAAAAFFLSLLALILFFLKNC